MHYPYSSLIPAIFLTYSSPIPAERWLCSPQHNPDYAPIHSPHARPSLARGLPLRSLLVLPFALQIFAAVGLTGWLSIRNGQRAVNDVISQLRSEVTTRIHQQLGTFL